MLLKGLLSLLVWAAVTVVCFLVGKALGTVEVPTVANIGAFFVEYCGLIGFLAGIAYFIWGRAMVK